MHRLYQNVDVFLELAMLRALPHVEMDGTTSSESRAPYLAAAVSHVAPVPRAVPDSSSTLMDGFIIHSWSS